MCCSFLYFDSWNSLGLHSSCPCSFLHWSLRHSVSYANPFQPPHPNPFQLLRFNQSHLLPGVGWYISIVLSLLVCGSLKLNRSSTREEREPGNLPPAHHRSHMCHGPGTQHPAVGPRRIPLPPNPHPNPFQPLSFNQSHLLPGVFYDVPSLRGKLQRHFIYAMPPAWSAYVPWVIVDGGIAYPPCNEAVSSWRTPIPPRDLSDFSVPI